jgi:hypothetical protein
MGESDLHIATVQKNAREELRIILTEFKGYRLCSMRVFFEAKDGAMRPGKAGLAIRVEKLPDLIEALSKAQYAVQLQGDAHDGE